MKKNLAIILCVFILLPTLLCSCSVKNNEDKIKIVCTLFPQYDWVRNIVGESENVEVSLLIKNGADPHSYQPTAADILMLTNCDMIISSGPESDTWVKDALKEDTYDSIVRISLCEIPSMSLHDISSSSGGHLHDGEEEHTHEHHGALDEHVWLSLKNAVTATQHITEAICKLDKQNEGKYISNSQKYVSSLLTLDAEYATTVGEIEASERFMIFADRFPFVYLLSDYEIGYQAAFEGCTADVDASFDTVVDLVSEADAHNVPCIAVTESSDKALAQTVAESVKRDGVSIITLNSMQAVSQKSIENGITYLSEMQKNLEQIKLALSY